MADTGKRKEGLSGGRRGARLFYKSGRRRAQPRCRPSIPASVPHAPTQLSGHCQVPVTFSLRSRPHAAAEGGAPGLSRAESCVPGTLGWARKPLLGRRLQNHLTTEGWEGQGMAAGLGQDQNQPRWAQNPYPSALGTGRAEGHGSLSSLHFRLSLRSLCHLCPMTRLSPVCPSCPLACLVSTGAPAGPASWCSQI